MHIDALLSQPSQGLRVPKSWSQGRTVFGGLTAALLYQAIINQQQPLGPLRSLSVHFLRPLSVAQPFDVKVTELRAGKNIQVVQSEAIQQGEVAATATACFGLSRDSKLQIVAQDAHAIRSPKRASKLLRLPVVGPAFLQHVDIDLVEGRLPFLGGQSATYAGYMRFREPPAEVTDAHLITLFDCWPPAVLQRFRKPVPASTLSWNLEFLHPHQSVQPEAWLGYQAVTRQVGEGYAHTEANIWDPHGQLMAVSRQVVMVFD